MRIGYYVLSLILAVGFFVGSSVPFYSVHAEGSTPDTDKSEIIKIDVYSLTDQGIGDSLGTLKLRDSKKGLLISTNLKSLPPGSHGFHLHEYPDCSPMEKDGKMVAGLAAGGHFDPDHTGKHLGPEGNGHKGDLPVLVVAVDGKAHETLAASHLSLADVHGHAFIIHEGGDNYSDDPKPLGGGAARIACAIVP